MYIMLYMQSGLKIDYRRKTVLFQDLPPLVEDNGAVIIDQESTDKREGGVNFPGIAG
jgi:hypothetical protein